VWRGRNAGPEAGPLLSVPVYAGGDALLAFCPASTTIDVAEWTAMPGPCRSDDDVAVNGGIRERRSIPVSEPGNAHPGHCPFPASGHLPHP
jgi:hypothetical protein